MIFFVNSQYVVFSLDLYHNELYSAPIMKEMDQEEKNRCHRRFFLANGLTYLGGILLGLNLFSIAEANERHLWPMPKSRRQGTSFSAPPSRIALIIDDIGHSLSRAHAFLSLNMPMTFSILPQLRHSNRLAEEITGKGHEVMLHQPMEPYCNEIHPGPGAVYLSYGNRKIEETIQQNLSQIPQATGVNNHMGSKFTSCSSKVVQALRIIKKKNLFFVDSLTSSHSQGYKMARQMNMRTAPRNVFLDHTPDLQAIRLQLIHLKQHALKHGAAIGIGHPHLSTLTALQNFKQELDEKEPRVELVSISNLL
jgi:polysaccharide deacetylase 2 family uncharacterized protein YibQ